MRQRTLVSIPEAVNNSRMNDINKRFTIRIIKEVLLRNLRNL